MNVLKSIRFDAETMKIIEKSKGDNFTEKLLNIIKDTKKNQELKKDNKEMFAQLKKSEKTLAKELERINAIRANIDIIEKSLNDLKKLK